MNFNPSSELYTLDSLRKPWAGSRKLLGEVAEAPRARPRTKAGGGWDRVGCATGRSDNLKGQ